MNWRLCVLPNDPLFRYVEKGEIKPRYWNPKDFFDEVHIISLSDRDVEAEEVQTVAGRAKLFIHPIGRPGPFHLYSHRQRVLNLITQIRPHVIRAHNPLLMGWYAVSAGKTLGIPSIVSIHDDYSISRRLKIYGSSYWSRALYQLAFRLLGEERFTLQNATKIILPYRFLCHYLSSWRKDYELIYNRIFLDQFQKSQISKNPEMTVLNVGQQFAGKNPQNILRAIKELPVKLILIGQGPLHEFLQKVTKGEHLDNKVEFLRRVPHEELQHYYASSHIFAMHINQPGVCMPVMEAMASGLPIVINRPLFEETPEVLGNRGFIVEDTPEGYRKGIQKLLENESLREEMGLKGQEKIRQMDGSIMEEKERDLYLSLCNGGALKEDEKRMIS